MMTCTCTLKIVPLLVIVIIYMQFQLALEMSCTSYKPISSKVLAVTVLSYISVHVVALKLD